MLRTMQQAESLSFECRFTWSVDDERVGNHIYRVWLKKPNSFRVEVAPRDTGKVSGILVGDGETAWIYWPEGRPQWELVPEDPETYERTRLTSYRKTAALAGRFSILHAMAYTAADTVMPILNPSVFFGFQDSLSPFIDGVRSLGAEQIGEVPADKIEVSIMDGQRSWYLWISQHDHLPRKLQQIVRTSGKHVMEEEWSNVIVNGEISNSLFEWTPPEGWTEWRRPEPDEILLRPGTKAPDFDLASADGGRIKLSDYHGQVVWLYFWRVGCPPCRTGMPDVESFHKKYKDRGLVVLGLNEADDREIALDFMREAGATFPTILDSSEAARDVSWDGYRTTGVPVNYIIDREGKVVDAWYGHYEDHTRELAALKRAGLELEETAP
jgi:peroxiredoxin/outer membrane lipoprotein-sorting protein